MNTKKRNIFSVTLDDGTAENVRLIADKINQKSFESFGIVTDRTISKILRRAIEIGMTKMVEDGIFNDEKNNTI